MNNRITFEAVRACLEASALRHTVWTLGDGVRLIVLERGGRILGPFLPGSDGRPRDDAESLYWLHEAWRSPARFAEFIASGAWNQGGERVWIAPEIQFMCTDRARFVETLGVPPEIDPGSFVMEVNGAANDTAPPVTLRQQPTLPAHNLATGRATLDLTIGVQPVADPLRALAEYDALREGVVFAGYEQVITLAQRTPGPVLAEAWNLIQLNPGGTVILPLAPRARATDYDRGPVPTAAQTVQAGAVRLPITGDGEFKVGYKAAHITGRAGYLNALDGGSGPDARGYLLVRQFTNNPAATYTEEPAAQPGNNGHSVHIYNGHAGFGGFGELECNGQAVGDAAGRAVSLDIFRLWLYAGPLARLRTIAEHLLGVTID